MAARRAILHITSAEGGGTDRYIRDLVAATPGRHWIWHAAPGPDVIEDTARRRFGVLADDAALGRFLQESGIGLVHLHGVTPDCTARLDRVLRAAALPYAVTLHDVTFVAPDAFAASQMPAPGAAWIAATGDRLRAAAAVIVPSAYIRDLVAAHFGDIAVHLIAPGVRPPAARPAAMPQAEFAARWPRHVVAAVGAIGPHKGSALLPSIAAELAAFDAALVVIGYTDTQVAHGWVVPDQMYVHGPYEDEALPGLLRAYGAECVLFPNRMPESFSYTLSEAWARGLPVIVPDEGALGERVAARGGGWRLPAGYGALEAATLLARLLGPEGRDEWARVKSQIALDDPVRVPTLDAMARDFDALYERLTPPRENAGSDSDTLAPLVAANLDGFAFRRELVNLADELARVKAALAEARPWVAKLERDIAETRAWAQKLEHDVDVLKSGLTEKVEENRRLADIRDAFDVLPVLARKALLKLAFRGRR
jgi:glycosyltransferase involved in cell wall biosynthesis